MRVEAVWAVLTAVILAPTSAMAQDGAIAGRVLDVAGDTLPGVTIEAGGSALAEPRVAVTDRQGLYRDAREGYRRFLALTNFESSFAEKLGFIFGVARRRHADREDPWRRLRTAGYLGLCITENKTYNPLRAREYCTRALDYGEDDPIAHFLLGNINRDLFNLYPSCDYLVAAARSYDRMLSLNEFLAESGNARNYLEQITGILPQLGC